MAGTAERQLNSNKREPETGLIDQGVDVKRWLLLVQQGRIVELKFRIHRPIYTDLTQAHREHSHEPGENCPGLQGENEKSKSFKRIVVLKPC